MQYWDHPRGCGENQGKSQQSYKCLGSPPRMRGKLFEPPYPVYRYRITPADAGKTYGKFGMNPNVRDHPRGCGENAGITNGGKNDLGSPPRMRGKREGKVMMSVGTRITPADAGKT